MKDKMKRVKSLREEVEHWREKERKARGKRQEVETELGALLGEIQGPLPPKEAA